MSTESLDDWDFDLPDAAIARHPTARRDGSRLMVVPRDGGTLDHLHFSELPSQLREGDLLVVNDSRVMPARLAATRASGGRVELLLLGTGADGGPIPCLARPARRLKVGERLAVEGGEVEILSRPNDDGVLEIRTEPAAMELMEQAGRMPLPPYLGRDAEAADRERYQTVYARHAGSSAAPTAGLHFTPELLQQLQDQGVGRAHVTLHVGLGTFRPLRELDLERGSLHVEPTELSEETAAQIAATRARGGRVIAVGTTAARTLESRAEPDGSVRPGRETTDLFIRPPRVPAVVDGLITNFHLPRSSLLMLVASLCSRERVLSAYGTAIERGYRFYSYGDAMLLL